jgi:hypothetical protein
MHNRLNELQKHDMEHLKALQRRKGKRWHPYNVLLWMPVLMILLIAVIFILLKARG